MNIEQILRNPQLRIGRNEELIASETYFKGRINFYVSENNEIAANSWAILYSIFNVQNNYIKIFELFELGEYYLAWCQLEGIEIAIKSILKHHKFIDDEYKILFIKEYVLKLQSLFPYKLFGSSELVKKEIRCSICDSIISLRNRCIHKKGELYMGEMCSFIVTKSEMVGMSLVNEPFNKYSVIGVTKKDDDTYKYPQIDFLMSIIDHPFTEWRTKDSKVLESHEKFNSGRNEECPCRSRKKYKKCCLKKDGIEFDHTEFILKYPTIKSQQNNTFSKNPTRLG